MFVQTIFVALLSLLLGAALCFAGYRLFVTLLPLWGFFAGLLVTAQAIQELFGGGFLATVGSWVFGFLVGVICALCAYFFYTAAIILLAASVGYELGVGLLSGFGVNAGFSLFLVGLVGAVIVSVLVIALNIPKALVVILTALVGASLILTGLLLATGSVSLTSLHWGVVGDFIHSSWFWLLAYLAFSAAGIGAQLFAPSRQAAQHSESVGPLRSAT